MINNMKPNIIKYKDVMDRIAKPMTDSDLQRYLGAPSSKYIVKYSDLDNYNTINDLLPKEKDFKIILTEQEFNNGHWTCIMRYKDDDKDVIEYFNSYGSKPSYELGFISKIKNLFLGQEVSANTNAGHFSRIKFSHQKDNIDFQRIYDPKYGINWCREQSTDEKQTDCGKLKFALSALGFENHDHDLRMVIGHSPQYWRGLFEESSISRSSGEYNYQPGYMFREVIDQDEKKIIYGGKGMIETDVKKINLKEDRLFPHGINYDCPSMIQMDVCGELMLECLEHLI